MFEPSVPSEIQSSAQAAVHWAKERFETDLDFSEQSLQEVERILDRLCDRLPKNSWGKLLKHAAYQKEIAEMALVWGSYVGEVIRRNYCGEWHVGSNRRNRNAIALQLQGITLFPIEKVSKRLTHHPEDNLWFYYQSFKQMQQQHPPHHQAA